MSFIFLFVIVVLVAAIMFTISVWKKSKRSNYQKILMTIIFWIAVLIIELILIQIYFAIQY